MGKILNNLDNLKIIINEKINEKYIIEKIDKQNREIDKEISNFNDIYLNNISMNVKNKLKE